MGEHDGCPLGEDCAVPFVRLEEKVGCRGEKLVFGVFVEERVKGMPDTCRVDNEDGSQSCSIACGLGKELAFDVVDDNRVAPGQKLGGGKKALASSSRGYDQKVAKLAAGFDRSHAKHVVEVAYAKNEARLLVEALCHELCQLVDPCKTGAVNFVSS